MKIKKTFLNSSHSVSGGSLFKQYISQQALLASAMLMAGTLGLAFTTNMASAGNVVKTNSVNGKSPVTLLAKKPLVVGRVAGKSLATNQDDGFFIQPEADFFVVSKATLNSEVSDLLRGDKNVVLGTSVLQANTLGLGGGAMINTGYQLNNFKFGLALGYHYVGGDVSETFGGGVTIPGLKIVYNESVIPVMATLAYQFNLGKFSITPIVDGGMAVRVLKLTTDFLPVTGGKTNEVLHTVAGTIVTGVVDGGLGLGYNVIPGLDITLSGKVGYLFGANNVMVNATYFPKDKKQGWAWNWAYAVDIKGLFYGTVGAGVNYKF
ncbi:MAG: hypothetical protein QM529_04500 [Hydrotalea sp.]|nr:hypothetical protein [Hydrotalea sp.]